MSHRRNGRRPPPHRAQSTTLDNSSRVGDHIRFHPRLLEFAGHYHFAPQPCAVARGNEKGRVERTIRYLRDSFFAARHFASLDDLNAQLAAWITDTAHTRPRPGDPERRSVALALEGERPRLLPVPDHPFPCDLLRPVVSGKTPYVRFDGNDYSIPYRFVRRPLTLVASDTAMRRPLGDPLQTRKRQKEATLRVAVLTEVRA